MAPEAYVGKVTDFITRRVGGKVQLALFRHPYAGIQLPAGTVEQGEEWEAAALREGFEETGLKNLHLIRSIGSSDWEPPQGMALTRQPCKVYARPDESSFDWAGLPRGETVNTLGRNSGPFTQVTYIEMDDAENPQYVTYQITGWLKRAVLCRVVRRAFFHLGYDGLGGPDTWPVAIDNHVFTVFWADLNDLPALIPFQQAWLDDLGSRFHYSLRNDDTILSD